MAADLPAHGEGVVSVSGWIHRRRRLKAVDFLILRDRTGLIQIVVGDEHQRAVLGNLPEESVVRVDGTAVRHAAAPGGIEITEPVITVLSAVTEPVAVELWRPHLDLQLATLLDHADVTLRHPARRAVFTLSAAALAGYRAVLTA